MPRRPRKLRLVANAESPKLPPDEGARPILSRRQRQALIAYAIAAEARADAIPDIEPFDPADDAQPRPPRRRRLRLKAGRTE
jgi:hypothetical protein